MMKPVLVKLIRCSEEVSFCGAVRAASKSTNTALAAGLVLERLPDEGATVLHGNFPIGCDDCRRKGFLMLTEQG